jgi:hypothetical protein
MVGHDDMCIVTYKKIFPNVNASFLKTFDLFYEGCGINNNTITDKTDLITIEYP